jgi:hypothetical protein
MIFAINSTSCRKSSEVVIVPEDFNFNLSFGVEARNNVDTYAHKLTKDLILDGTQTIDFTFSEKAMQKIYAAFKSNEVSFIEPVLENTSVITIPSNTMVLNYTVDGVNGKVTWENGLWEQDFRVMEDQNRFIAFVDVVKACIYESQEYKSLKPATGAYQ